MITIYFTNGIKLELRAATRVTQAGFLGSPEAAGVQFLDPHGATVAEFKLDEIAGYECDVEAIQRRLELGPPVEAPPSGSARTG